MKIIKILVTISVVVSVILIIICFTLTQIGGYYEGIAEEYYYDVPLTEAQITHEEARKFMINSERYYSLYAKVQPFELISIVSSIVILFIYRLKRRIRDETGDDPMS